MRLLNEFRHRSRIDGLHALLEARDYAALELRKRLAYIRNRLQFGGVGKRSAVLRPLLLTNPRFFFIGDDVTIREGARLEAIRHYGGRVYNPRVTIGDRTFAEYGLHVTCAERVEIGTDVLIAGNVYISDANHGRGYPGKNALRAPLTTRPVTIGDGTWIGERACVLPGVSLGEGCVVGAGAVVTRSFPAYSVIGGIPARLIRAETPPSADHAS